MKVMQAPPAESKGKILKILFVCLGIFVMTAVLPLSARAETDDYEMEVGIPGSDEFEKKEEPRFDGSTATIGRYIKAVYTYAIGVVGVLAVVVLMIGGVIWLTAGGNVNKVESAKQWIGGALTGLVLVLTSYMLLYQINPDLVNFQATKIRDVDKASMPEWEDEQCVEDGTQCARVENENPQDLPLCANCCDNRYHSIEGDNFCGPSPSEEADDTDIGCCIYDMAKKCEANITKEDCKDDKGGEFSVGEDLECENQAKLSGSNYKCE